MPSDRLNVLGVGVSPLTIETALERFGSWIRAGAREYVCVCTVHGVMECQKSERLRRIFNSSGMVTPDGMPLVWLLWHSGHSDSRRVYGPDLMIATMESGVSKGWKHFLYGGRDDVAERLGNLLSKRYRGLKVVGFFSPPVAPLEELVSGEIAKLINSTQPDFVWVGIGSPKQELWMAEMRGLLDAHVLIGVGAAFDFHAGLVRQAPRWIQNAGMEWAHRLSQEPRRLWRRYLINNPWFVYEVARQRFGLSKYD